MRARGLLKGNPAPSLCIFCASRLLAEELQPVTTASLRHRRFLNTTRPPYQSAATAAHAVQSNNDGGNTPARSWDPNSDLTPTERAEKERRRRQQTVASGATQSQAGAREVQSDGLRGARAQQAREQPLEAFPRIAKLEGTANNPSEFRFKPVYNPRPQTVREPESKASDVKRRNAQFPERGSYADRGDVSNVSKVHPRPRDTGPEHEWQHLSRKATARPPPQESPQPSSGPTIYRPLLSQNTDATIDRAFADHQQTRRPPPTPSDRFSASDIRRSTNGLGLNDPHRTAQRCARCLEYGHVARDCTGPVKATCNFCGQSGHFSRECPQRFAWSDSRPSQPPRSAQGNVSPRSTMAADSGADHEIDTVRVESESAGVPSAEERERDRRARRSLRGFEDEADESDVQRRDDRRSRRSNRNTVNSRDDDADDEAASLREQRAARKAARKAAQKAEREAERREATATVSLPDFISVSQLAQTLGVHYEHFVGRLKTLGYDDVFPGKVLNAETSGMIAMEYNFDPLFEESAEKLEEAERDLKSRPEIDDKSLLPTRPPVVTIMGHVDHGKTTILDYLRKSSVAAGEAGGITQHIGAFSVDLSGSGKSITFLDTPGHAAFLAMRQRGANVTDIVVLVVAADDSVKPQTLESLRCAREAGVPILVAINKIDKEEADIQRVKNDLARNGVEIEDFGGDTQVVCVSGKTGKGMEELEEAAVTLSEILDHRAETDGDVEGWLLEATTKKAGRVATVLVKRGTLRPGAVIVAGKAWARVKTLRNQAGQLVEEALPGTPIEVDGWREQPVAGDQVLQASNESKAADVVEYRIEKEERLRTAQDMEVINEARRLEQEKRLKEKAEKALEQAAKKTGAEMPVSTTSSASPDEQDSGQLSVPFIIKADVSGSAEAVSAYIPSLTSPLIYPQILYAGVGPVHESDIEFAATAEGHIIAFNLPADAEAKAAAEAQGVKILENNIIYRVLDDVKAILEEKLPPLISQRVLGEAEIGAVFDIKLGGRKVMWIAGCKVRNGVIGRGSRARVMRGSEKIYDGTVTSLKNVKKDVQEMRKGTECGMGFDGWEGFQVGDVVQTYEEISEKRKL